MLRKLLSVALLVFVTQAWAGANDVMVDKVWMRESVPDQLSVTVQMNLSVTKAARLLSVSSPVAKSGEIQNVEKRRGKLRTSKVGSLRLAPHSTTIFGTQGVYLVLNGLKQRLNIGDRVPVSLVIEMGGKKRTINLEVEVKALELSYKHYNDPTVKDHR